MSQITVRLANEGVPVQAIARATGTSSSDVRAELANALLTGDLLNLPLNDWPAGERRPAKVVDATKPALESAARRVLGLTPLLARLLVYLLRAPEVSRQQLAVFLEDETSDLNFTYVTMWKLRRRLDVFGVTIHSMYGHGYCMSLAHQRKIKSLLRS